jgi:monofunctional glycosyltransferase
MPSLSAHGVAHRGAGPARPSARRRWWRVLVLLPLVALLASAGWVGAYRLLSPPLTPLMVIRSYQGEGTDYRWVPLAEVAPTLIRAVIASEDQKFCQHGGFDRDALAEAWQAYQEGGRARGASTITMQTAKNLFLWPGRSMIRKGLEAYFTVLLELLWPKARILEAYLNVAEFGPGIYGAEAAAQRFFGKRASALTAAEAARLAAVLPNPRRYSAAQPSAYVLERSAIIRLRMASVSATGPAGCLGGRA